MKSLFKILCKVFAVAALCVIVFLFLQVIGDAQHVIDSYEQLTGNSIGATNSIKIAFLREYVQHTGKTDILFTVGITQSEADLIIKDDLIPDDLANPDDETQIPGEDGDPVQNNPTPPGGSVNPTPDPGGTNPTPGVNPTPDPGTNPNPTPTPGNNQGGNITSGGSAGFMKQSDPVIAQLKGGSGSSTMSNAGCGIVALYNAYCANTSNPISMKEMMLRYSNDKLGGAVKEDSNGNLQGKIGDLAEGAGLWNWMASNYYNPGSVTQGGGKTVNQGITQDGNYIVYFNHADSGQHWVYATKSGNNWTVQNPNNKKEGNNIGNLTLRKYYKIS